MHKKILKKSMLKVCAEIYEDDGLNPKYDKKNYRKKGGRKSSQLCSQVADALYLALSDCGDDILRNLYVVKVESVDLSRMVVTLARQTKDHVSVSETYQRLGILHPKLRTEIATAIHRKKTPELSFIIL